MWAVVSIIPSLRKITPSDTSLPCLPRASSTTHDACTRSAPSTNPLGVAVDARVTTGLASTSRSNAGTVTWWVNPPSVYTAAVASTAPTTPDSSATDHVRISPPPDSPVRGAGVAARVPPTSASSDGWRHSRSSGGRSGPDEASSRSSSGSTASEDTDGHRILSVASGRSRTL